MLSNEDYQAAQKAYEEGILRKEGPKMTKEDERIRERLEKIKPQLEFSRCPGLPRALPPGRSDAALFALDDR